MARYALKVPGGLRLGLLASLLALLSSLHPAAATDPLSVPVDIFVSALSPESVQCELRLDEALAPFREAIFVTLHFVGTRRPEDQAGSFYCRRGPLECTADLQQMCVQKYAATAAQRYDWAFAFAVCNSRRLSLGDLGTPGTGQMFTDCIREVRYTSPMPPGMPAAMRTCWRDAAAAEREAALDAEFRATAALGVAAPCALRVDGAPVCAALAARGMEPDALWEECMRSGEVERALCEAAAAKAGGDASLLPAACAASG